MKAVEIKRMPRRGAMADQRLFECEPGGPLPRFVIVSAVGPETYVFASDESGEVKNWTELEGSFRGELDHGRALRRAGYELVEKHAGER